MKRGFPTDPSLIVFAASETGSGKACGETKNKTQRVVELRPLLRDSDSGLGPSFLGSSYDTSMTSVEEATTPKSNRSDISDLNTPQPARRRFLYRSSDGSPLGALKASSSSSFSPLQLSSTSHVSEYRFDGASISSVCSNGGLTKLGSPETRALQTPASENERESGRGISRRLDMAPIDRTDTPSRCLPFSPSKELSGNDFLGGFTSFSSTSTPLRTEFPLNPTQLRTLASFPAPVLPSLTAPSPRKRSAPLTPTPIKRAMAFLRTSQATPPRLPTDFQDVEEMMKKESASLGTCQGIEYSTPSKLMRWEGMSGEGPLLGAPLDVGLPGDPLVGSSDDFVPPPFTPEKMSAAWCRIALGKTSPQRELTEMARQLLNQPLPDTYMLQQQVTPTKLTYAQL